MSASFDVRTLEGDDFDQYFDVRAQAFAVPGDERADWLDLVASTPDVVSFGAFRRGRLLGALRVIPGGQFVHGRSVPMGGIAAVVVRPEARGGGVARSLLAHTIEWMRTTGIVVSSLHPASTRAYRSAGWELAGRAGWLATPTRSFSAIRGDAPAAPVEPLDPTGDPEVRACYARSAPGVPGAVDRSPAFWWLHERKAREDGAFLYGVRTDGELTGYVAYTQTPDASWGYGLRIDDVCAHDRASAVALWRFIGGHSMQVERVQLPVSALPALSFLLDEQDAVTELENHWMHRIVDVPGAIAARGFPAGSSGSVTFGVSDPLTPGAVAAWSLTVAAGRGTAVAADPGDAEVTLDVGALSALAIGGSTIELLGRAGRVTGTEDGRRRLGGLLLTPAPVITDDF